MVLVDSSAPTYPDDRRSALARVRPLNALFLRFALRPGYVRKNLRGSFYDGALATPELALAYLDRLRVEGEEDAYYGLTAPSPRPRVVVDLARIDVPALVVWGAEDRLIRPEKGEEAARRLPQGAFVLMERTGHVPMEERPEEWLRIVLPFLARQAR
jgi:2-hydroxy-6-oxonona-2,4-dienedioate hydrolase